MPYDKLFEDAQTVAEIHKWLPFAKLKADNLIKETSTASSLLNANSLKSLIQQSLPWDGGSSVQLTVEWVCFLDSYLRQLDHATLLTEAKSLWQYVVSLCVSFFGKADLRVLYSCPEMVDLFNEFITHFAHLNSDLTSKCLLDTTNDYLTLHTECLNYLEYLTIDRLCLEKRFNEVVTLYRGHQSGNEEESSGNSPSSIMTFTSIDASSLSRRLVLRLFVNCAKALFIDGDYSSTHETLAIVFNLPVTMSQDGEISEIISLYVLTVILLDKKLHDVDPYLIKFASVVPPNLLKIFQCYYSCQFEQFVRLVLLEYTQRKEAFGDDEYLFTKSVVARLLANMCVKKNAGTLGKLTGLPEDKLKQNDAAYTLGPLVRQLGIDIETEIHPKKDPTVDDIEDMLHQLVKCDAQLGKVMRM